MSWNPDQQQIPNPSNPYGDYPPVSSPNDPYNEQQGYGSQQPYNGQQGYGSQQPYGGGVPPVGNSGAYSPYSPGLAQAQVQWVCSLIWRLA